MTERPILFSAPMVRALLDGTKTQTRRALRGFCPPNRPEFDSETGRLEWFNGDEVVAGIRCPYGMPGGRLWVRETFIHEPADYCWEASVSIPCRPASTVYRADFPDSKPGEGWKPSIHMPRRLSRITLEVTGVRVERLQAISEEDAMAEGIVAAHGGFGLPDGSHFHATNPRVSYWSLWDAINGAGSVERNPLVWVVEFRKAHNEKGNRPA